MFEQTWYSRFGRQLLLSSRLLALAQIIMHLQATFSSSPHSCVLHHLPADRVVGHTQINNDKGTTKADVYFITDLQTWFLATKKSTKIKAQQRQTNVCW